MLLTVFPLVFRLTVTGPQLTDLAVHYLEVLKRSGAKNIALT